LGSHRALRGVLSLLNARLSYWMLNPGARNLNPFPSPGFVCLLREMTGLGMTTNCKWLNLSDGGHIENLGLYELFRRRCKFIVSVDGEQDGAFQFGGLLTALRHAQIDLGLRFSPSLDEIRNDPVTGSSRSHFTFFRIDYPDAAAPGFLLYLKSSLTGNEDELVKRYKLLNPEFPHQSTLDQFFSQEQFEIYRRLGAHIAEGLFGEALTGGATQPATVAAWFHSLAASFIPAEAKGESPSCFAGGLSKMQAAEESPAPSVAATPEIVTARQATRMAASELSRAP
jgi:hypothetical protein